MKTRIRILFLYTYIFLVRYKTSCDAITGADIGNTCTSDAECTAGNGGPYSKCHRPSSTCICTVNIIGENKCDIDEKTSWCVRKAWYPYTKVSSLECSPEDESFAYKAFPTFFQMELNEFVTTFVNDKRTPVCFDPKRAFNTAPDGIVIKTSPIPNAGYGVFTNVFIEKGTVFGPCKGYYYTGNSKKDSSKWSWKFHTYGDTSVDNWIDGKHIYMSSWLRFINMAPTADALNVMHFEYEGGDCNETGKECANDKNALCLEALCICKHGTHYRHGFCMKDETLGGICTGSDGDMCEKDNNAECQGGVCVCKKGSSIFKDKCIPDETYGGRCSSPDGQECLLDPGAECVNGLCRCKYRYTEVDGKCMKNEMIGGRCLVGSEGEPCFFEKSAVCQKGLCKCKQGSTYINGKCV